MSTLLVRRSGTLIDISPDGRSPLDPHVVDLLRPLLSYDHKTLLQGHHRYGPDGQVRSIDIEKRDMFAIEEGRLTTGFGFLTSIVNRLKLHGYDLHYIDVSPPRQRPDCYVPDWENVNRHVSFRARQRECLQLITQNEIGLINAATGFGKTFMFSSIAHCYPHAKIHIVVRPKDVAARIVRELSKTMPNIGQIGGGKSFMGDRITVFTAGSLHRSDGDCDILLADEVHLLMTGTTASELGRAYRFSRNFGFTATPDGRMDGADAQLELFFGRQIFALTYEEAVALALVVPIHVRWLVIRDDYNPAKDKSGVPRMRWGVWRNDFRNQAIANDVRTNHGDPDTQVLILCATIDHAIHLWQQLPEFSMCYGSFDPEELARYKKNGMLPDTFIPTDAARREQMRLGFEEGTLKKVIATDVWATGVDFDQLGVLYRVDARESEILDTQAPGRVSRIHADKSCGEVIDCYDAFDTALKRKADTRRRHYKNLNWTQSGIGGRRQFSNA